MDAVVVEDIVDPLLVSLAVHVVLIMVVSLFDRDEVI